jgi:hypothetical protein
MSFRDNTSSTAILRGVRLRVKGMGECVKAQPLLLSLAPAEIGVAMSLGYWRELKHSGVGGVEALDLYQSNTNTNTKGTGMTIASYSQQVQPQLRPVPTKPSQV